MPKSMKELIKDEVRRRVDEDFEPSRALIEKLAIQAVDEPPYIRLKAKR